MYDKLVKRLRRCQQFKCRECEYERVLGCRAMLNAEAADAIEELSMKLHGDEAAILGMKREIERMVVNGTYRWIPVTERLPEKHQWVLVASKLVKIRMDFISSDGHWYTTSGVTHWMPLPKPPEEKDDR